MRECINVGRYDEDYVSFLILVLLFSGFFIFVHGPNLFADDLFLCKLFLVIWVHRRHHG